MTERIPKSVPEIRFEGFDDDWHSKRIDEIAPLQRGFDLPTRNVKPGVFPVVYSNGILRTHAEYKCVAPGVVTGRSGTIGKVTFVDENYWPHNTSLWVTDFFGNDPQFIYYFYHRIGLERFDAGSTVPTLNRNDVHGVRSTIPEPLEQAQIGSYFKLLDRMIGLHQRKHDKLVTLKQAMLQKMFPQDGATTPEIRFKGFEGCWDRTQLGAISKTTIGEFVIQTKQNPSAPYPVFNGGRSYTGFYDEYNNEGGKILVSARGANAGFVNIVRQRYWAGNSCYSIALDDKRADLDFTFWFVKTHQDRFTENQQAANIPAVSKRDVEEFDFLHPSLTEQIKIGSYFRKLNHLISKHATQLEKLKNIKSACLEKMFV